MTFTDEAKAALAAPLDRKHVKPPAPGKYGDYVEGWHVIAEANRIFGFDGWTRETVSMVETNRELLDVKDRYGKDIKQWRVGYLVKVRVIAGDVMREGTGFGTGMGKPEALGEAIESAAKEGETDAMKRAMMTFGNPFGLALYDKTKSNVVDGSVDPPTDARTDTSEPIDDTVARTLFPVIQTALRACTTTKQLEGAWSRYLPVMASWSDRLQEDCDTVYQDMRKHLAEHDGDARKASRDALEGILRAAVSMDDLKAKWQDMEPAIKKLGRDDIGYLNAVKTEMKNTIEKVGGLMPDFTNLTPEQEHAAKVASTP